MIQDKRHWPISRFVARPQAGVIRAHWVLVEKFFGTHTEARLRVWELMKEDVDHVYTIWEDVA